ncbi:MAG: FG-GAP-like repeat-containing protein [bacterium]|nr:FG-GAP-like repeat-containing protein [bacterium]
MLLLIALVFLCSLADAHARVDTISRDNGVYSGVNTLTTGWEESIILQPGAPCRIVGISVYYVGTGTDTIRITGDASEGTIPPTVWAYAYNTLAKRVVNVSQTGWLYIDLSQDSLMIGGFDRVVVQHLVRVGAPQFGQDAGQSPPSSYYYDPTTPNPNFFQIPGIYYLSRGDYMVRLHVEYNYPAPGKGSFPMPAPSFVDVTAAVGLLAGSTPIKADMASIVDVNSDGFEDVVINGTIYLNQNGESFRRVSSGISPNAPSVWADVNGDGRPDCFSMQGFNNDRLFIQTLDGQFIPGSGIANNAPGVTPLWLDYDADGKLDLFIANGRTEQNGQEVYFPDRLFRNLGEAGFEDVTVQSNIANAEPSPFLDTWGASVCDYNNDGRPDIFVATYRLAPDRLYRNNGDGTFTDVSVSTGTQGMPTSVPGYFGHGMGSDWADIDNDGDVDLAVGNLGHPDSRAQYSNPSLLFKNSGPPAFQFTPITRANGGVTFKEMNAGMCFFDYDHDGDQDLWHGQISYQAFGSDSTRYSHMYRNDGAMTDVTWELGMRIHGAWTGVRFDFDRDGDMDILCSSGTENVKLFRNDASRGNSIVVKLRRAIQEPYGTRVVLSAQGKRYHRWLSGTVSGGRASQMTSLLHFGIGTTAQADSIVVYWPDGTITRVGPTLRNSMLTIAHDPLATIKRTSLAPRLKTPSNYASNIPTVTTLHWYSTQPDSGVATSYHVEASYDSTFATALITNPLGGIIDTTITLNGLLDGQTVYWRVRANDSGSRFSSVWNFTVGSPMPKTPTLIAPSQGEYGVRTKKAVFQWTRSAFSSYEQPSVTYDVQIASDTTFTDIVKEVTNRIGATLTGIVLQPLTEYAWRVRSRSSESIGAWSSVGHFATYGLPGAVALRLPADSATGQLIRPRFEWHDLAWEDGGYVFEYDSVATFATTTPRLRTDTVATPIGALKAGRRYFWHVAAKNDEGQGPWSATWSFVVDASSAVAFNTHNDASVIVQYNDHTSTCEIELDLATEADINVSVFDLTARCLADLANTTLSPGKHRFLWSSGQVPSGPYFISVSIGGVQSIYPIVVTR